jgi:hypothetical protein
MTISFGSCESEALFLFVPRLLVLLDFVALLLSTGLHSSVGGVGKPLDILLAICRKLYRKNQMRLGKCNCFNPGVV